MVTLEALFRALNAGGSRYIVVGGLAVVLHGHLRATGDVDLIVDLTPEEATKTIDVLERAGFQPYVPVPARSFADPNQRMAWAREKGMLVFSLRPADGVPMVDLFLEYPMPFEEMWRRSAVVTVHDVPIRIAAIDDLITLKQGVGRPEDIADVDALQNIQRARSMGVQ